MAPRTPPPPRTPTPAAAASRVPTPPTPLTAPRLLITQRKTRSGGERRTEVSAVFCCVKVGGGKGAAAGAGRVLSTALSSPSALFSAYITSAFSLATVDSETQPGSLPASSPRSLYALASLVLSRFTTWKPS